MSRVHGMMIICVAVLLGLVLAIPYASEVAAASTTEIRIAKYATDGITVLEERSVSYEWLEENLPVLGDGVTHYYHQGPIFEGDVWDETETLNLKDKGAVKGTSVRELCDLVGGMSPGDEIMLKAADGYHVEFAYENIYEPLPRQGSIALCWYNGEDALSGERYGEGYPDAKGYHTAMQIIFMAGTTNPDDKYVFGNSDMRVCLPDEKYQHFYEGLPSTNGLSGKWISEIGIYPDHVPEAAMVASNDVTPAESSGDDDIPWLPIGLGAGGVLFVGAAIFIWRRA